MSHETLRLHEMQEKLRELRTTNDPFWAELNLVNRHHTRPVISALVVEDLIPEPEDEEVLDDSGLSLKDIVAVTHQEPVRNKGRRCISKCEDGGLMAAADADDIDAEPLPWQQLSREQWKGKTWGKENARRQPINCINCQTSRGIGTTKVRTSSDAITILGSI
jgi:hypothetical protein